MDVPGLPNAVDQITDVAQSYTISALKDLPNGVTKMAMDFTAEKMLIRVGNNTVAASDSKTSAAGDNTNNVAAMLRRIVGAHFGYEIDAQGKASHITGVKEFFAHVPTEDNQGSSILKSMMSEDLIRQFATRGQGLPPDPVKLGDHWKLHLEENAGSVGVLQMDLNYIFSGFENHDGHHCAAIDFNGTVMSKPSTNAAAMNITVEGGSILGKMWFDPELNMVMETGSDQMMTMKILAQGKTIHSQMKQTVDIRMTGVGDLPK
jgi:hypothetical protein